MARGLDDRFSPGVVTYDGDLAENGSNLEQPLMLELMGAVQ